MADDTTNDLPSAETLRLIENAGIAAVAAEAETSLFVYPAAVAREAFDAEVDPLHLPDARYEVVAEACGLTGLLAIAHRMEEALTGLTQVDAA
jgi:hypothetical protein